MWPSEEAAVVGGNVLTSQRIVDLIFKAFEICAASQVFLIYKNFSIPPFKKLKIINLKRAV